MSQQQSSNEKTGCGGGLARILTAIFMLLTVLVFACYVAIFLNPHLPFNPWPPLTGHAAAPTPSAQVPATTAVPTFTPPPTFPPTWTPTLTPIPTETLTPRPTSTPAPPTATPSPTVPPTSTPRPVQFTLRGDPIFVRQTLYPGAGNWWTGVAGEVSTLGGEPVTDVVIRIWDNKGHAWETQPGGAANYAQSYGTTYGGGGSYAWWEQVLDGSCQQEITVNVQVLANGKPASAQVTTKTTSDCQRNLVLVHFVKNW